MWLFIAQLLQNYLQVVKLYIGKDGALLKKKNSGKFLQSHKRIHIQFLCANFPGFFPWSSYFEACCLRRIKEAFSVWFWIPYSEGSNLRTHTEFFLENVNLLMFLITIYSLTLVFFKIKPDIKDAITYFSA